MARFRFFLFCFLVLMILSCSALAENIGLMEKGGTNSCSRAYGGATADIVFDGTTSGTIGLFRSEPEVYIIREWEQNAVIDEITIRATSAYATDFDILIWEYGMWKTVKTIRDNTSSRTTVPMEGVVTRKIKYRPISYATTGNYHNIYEIEIEGVLEDPFVPKPEEFFGERKGSQVYLSWEEPLETKEGAKAVSYTVLRAEAIGGSYGDWEVAASGITATSWSGASDISRSEAYCVVAVDKWGHTSEMTSPVILAAEGKIAGRVTDEQTSAPLAGVLVKVLGTQLEAETNSSGEYTLANVPVGEVQLEIAKVGYLRKLVEVELTTAGISNLNIALEQGEEIPGSPAFLTATSQRGKVILEWTAPGGQELRYNLYRSETPTFDGVTPLVTDISTTYWVDTTAIPSKIYYYAVSAVSVTNHESGLSNIVKASSQLHRIPVLVEPGANSVIYNTYVVMRWEPVIGASHYYVEYSLSPKFAPEHTRRRTIRTGTELVDLGLTPGNWYWRVQAIFEDDTVSDFSEVGTFSVVNTTDSAEVAFFDLWPKVVGREPYVNIHYVLNVEDHFVTIRVFDLNGRCVKTFFENYPAKAGHHEFSWDGRGDNNQSLRKGLYIMQFLATKPGQKYEVRKKIIVMN